MNIDPSSDSPMPFDAAVETMETMAVVPLLRETLEVVREQREIGAVRVRVLVDESLEPVDADVSVDEVTSQRVTRGVRVEARRDPWHEGEVLVVPIYEEVIVTERRLVLKEEIHITRLTHRTNEQQQVPVRRERAVVERRRPDGVWIAEET